MEVKAEVVEEKEEEEQEKKEEEKETLKQAEVRGSKSDE